MSQASQAVPTSGSGATNGGDWQPARASTARNGKTRMPYYSPPSEIEFCAGFPQRLVRLSPQGRAADFLRGARRPPEVLACLFVPALREQRFAAPAPRFGGELRHARRLHQRKKFRRMGEAGRRVAARQRELGQARQAAGELEAFGILPAVTRGALELRADLELAQAQACNPEVGLDARRPERDARAACELQAAPAPRHRVVRRAGVEQQMADEVVGDELIADLLQALEPAQRPRHAGERLVVLPRAGAQVIEPEERRTHVPLQVGLARDLERGLEVGPGARIIGEPHIAAASEPDHHQVLALVALVADAARERKRALETGDRRLGLRAVVVRLAAAVVGLHRDEIRETEALADLDR